MALDERDFFKEPFTRVELDALLAGRTARELFSFKSPSVKALGLEPDNLRDEQLIQQMLKEPRLIRRPIVRLGDMLLFGADVKRLQEALGGEGEPCPCARPVLR